MEITNIREAKAQLSKLIEHGDEWGRCHHRQVGRPMVRLVPIRADDSPRVGGQWKGRVQIANDFNVLPDHIAAAFGIDPRS